MARSMVSFGMFTARALSAAARSRGLPLMSPPPSRAETVSSLMIFVQTLDFLESDASFLCLIFDQRLWPDMPFLTITPPPSRWARAGRGRQRVAVPGVRADRRPTGRGGAPRVPAQTLDETSTQPP